LDWNHDQTLNSCCMELSDYDAVSRPDAFILTLSINPPYISSRNVRGPRLDAQSRSGVGAVPTTKTMMTSQGLNDMVCSFPPTGISVMRNFESRCQFCSCGFDFELYGPKGACQGCPSCHRRSTGISSLDSQRRQHVPLGRKNPS
jgi:hypothetical protein